MTPTRFAGAVGFLVVACLVAVVADGGQAARQPQQTVPVVPMKAAPAGPLPPIPVVNYAPARPMPVVQQVYEFAARHPEVLQYMPCYCGCERSAGHNGNHDCFVKSRAADGRIVAWDAHGIGCAICLEVGRRAMLLYNEKKSVVEIRNTIDREFGARATTQTPTPRPPQPAKG